MRETSSNSVCFQDESQSSVFIVDDDCSTLSYQSTESNESTYLSPNDIKTKYRSFDSEGSMNSAEGMSNCSRCWYLNFVVISAKC